MPLGCLAALFGLREPPGASPAPAASPPPSRQRVPDTLPLRTKRYFFSPDENAFFRALEDALHGTTYRAFPNVRLNDLFTITDDAQRPAVLGRLRDKHTDFLIVDAGDHLRPVLAIELDGTSQRRDAQKYRDSVKDVIFRSGDLRLLRLPSRRYRIDELRDLLRREGLHRPQ